MANLTEDIAAYEALRNEFELSQMSKWVLFHDRQLVAIHDSFADAANEAVERFGRGPYLIRQIGSESVTLPASLMHRPAHALDKLRF
jgi:hypothetical protein